MREDSGPARDGWCGNHSGNGDRASFMLKASNGFHCSYDKDKKARMNAKSSSLIRRARFPQFLSLSALTPPSLGPPLSLMFSPLDLSFMISSLEQLSLASCNRCSVHSECYALFHDTYQPFSFTFLCVVV